MAEAKEAQGKPSWIAVVYNPSKEGNDLQNFDELMGQQQSIRPPIGRYLLLPIVLPPGHKTGEAIATRSIFFRPGANLTDGKSLPIFSSDWDLMLSAEKDKAKRGEIPTLTRLIDKGVFQVFFPDNENGSPGYRNFGSSTAVQLINSTTHEDWLDRWMEAETRVEVIKAANEQRARILERKKRLVA